MAYAQPPKKTGLPREVLKWLQSLDLSVSPKNTRRDFSNGYLVAEIFSWYYPEDFPMHSYDNGTSLPTKLGNWSQIERFLSKQNLRLPKEVIDGTIHCKPGAAELLIQEVYSLLTNRRVQTLQEGEVDFTDRNYQEKLPMVARATASIAIKNNLRLSEVIAEPNITVNKQKIQAIIHMHLQRRRAERAENPGRFNVKPTLGELAIRLPPTSQEWQEESSVISPSQTSGSARMSPATSRGKAIVQFKEINVRQTDKPSVLSNIDMSSQIKGF
ncbi:spermatogenesis-associated protein 4 [Megalops cyprinoides]|uniref:spermatogenesis-associated protein 4 n=1 Tax=Megalops cyprinoides TaxID=118141 RepID=UPI0018644C63|nr:spermatogenesis-associated protein 4 [Megalops cyprinoides]